MKQKDETYGAHEIRPPFPNALSVAKRPRISNEASAAIRMKFLIILSTMATMIATGSVAARTQLPTWNPPQGQAAQPQAALPAAEPRPEAPLPKRKEKRSHKVAQASNTLSGVTGSRVAYRLGTGDKLKVTIYNNEKLSGDYPVGGDGKIGLPMLGRIAVGGMTLDEVTETLTRRLADGYFVSPQVTVDMAAYRPVYILGEVQKPGEYAYAENMTVYRLVAQAGGYTYRANKKKMRVRHDNSPSSEDTVAEDATLLPGDTIIVSERYF